MQLSKDLFIKLKESVSFFADFSTGELLALLKLAVSETFEDGKVIFKEKTHGDKMYIILSGTVRISRNIGNKQEEVLVKLQPGACFGEMGVIDQSPRSASATVEGGNAVLLSIKESLLSEHNLLLAFKLYKNFALMLATRLRETNDKLQNAAINDRASSAKVKDLLKKKLEKGASLQGSDLSGVDLSEVFMNNANLQNTVLVGAKFNATKCKEANFSNAKIANSSFTNITFENTNFQSADFTAANFDNTTFNTCNMSGATFFGAKLSEAQINEGGLNPLNIAKKKKK